MHNSDDTKGYYGYVPVAFRFTVTRTGIQSEGTTQIPDSVMLFYIIDYFMYNLLLSRDIFVFELFLLILN